MEATPEISNKEAPLTLTSDEVKALINTVRNLFFGAMSREERRNRIVETLERAYKVLRAEKDNPDVDEALFDGLSAACATAEERLSLFR